MSSRRSVLVGIIAIFVVLIAWKVFAGAGTESDDASSAGESITSVHNDAVADYEAAQASGKPIYVLFHSLTCQPCVEISAVVDQVMPDYDGQIVFVNVITDDESGRELADRFEFMYIPTSFFLASDGSVEDSFTGAMGEAEMRAYLDALLQGQ